jgi:hypothetical protein
MHKKDNALNAVRATSEKRGGAPTMKGMASKCKQRDPNCDS